jgi:hypothetical protein
MEIAEERKRANKYCQDKSSVIANVTSSGCSWEEGAGEHGALGALAGAGAGAGIGLQSCDSMVTVVDTASSLLLASPVCRPPECKKTLVVIGGNTTAVFEVAGYNWLFPGSFFFCLTCISTIGYGSFVPTTPEGKSFVIIYSIFGIAFFTFANYVVAKDVEARIFKFTARVIPLGHRIWSRLWTCVVTTALSLTWFLLMAWYDTALPTCPLTPFCY